MRQHLTLAIEGMSCGHCLHTVNQTLTGLPGVEPGSVRIGRADLSYDDSRIRPDEILRAVTEAGYPATPVARTDE